MWRHHEWWLQILSTDSVFATQIPVSLLVGCDSHFWGEALQDLEVWHYQGISEILLHSLATAQQHAAAQSSNWPKFSKSGSLNRAVCDL